MITYLHLYDLFRVENCIAYNQHHHDSSASGIYCQSKHDERQTYHNNIIFISTHDIRETPPSIAKFVTLVTKGMTTTTATTTTSNPKIIETTTKEDDSNPVWIWDYSQSIFSTEHNNKEVGKEKEGVIKTITSNKKQDHRRLQQQQQQQQEENTYNKYGFRSNIMKQQKSSIRTKPIPITTYFWMAVNIGLFLLYWQRHIDVTAVAINQQIYQDFSRAIAGNLSHFEIWHLGLNMMSTSTLGGELLDLSPRQGGIGSMPLFLYTASFLCLNTIVVVALYTLKARWTLSSYSTIQFPNMVGFSGILFAWMVVSTLQTQQRTCPVPIFPELCFDVYNIGGFSISAGPLVQLVFLQMILPRASFIGHLAGIVVGFAWHWNLLPSLEWVQPCILYPLAWIGGKYYVHRYHNNDDTTTNDDNHGRGHVLGGGGPGRRLGSASWRSASNSAAGGGNSSRAVISSLDTVRNLMVLHIIGMLCIYRRHSINSIIISELLVLIIWTAIIYVVKGGMKEEDDYWLSIGMLGRGLVVIILTIAVTDAMTLGGWLISRILWQLSAFLLVLWITRLLIFGVSICLICHILSGTCDLQNGQGIWNHVIGWLVVQPCRPVGKTLSEYLALHSWTGRFANVVHHQTRTPSFNDNEISENDIIISRSLTAKSSLVSDVV
jgi:hypothetical protein